MKGMEHGFHPLFYTERTMAKTQTNIPETDAGQTDAVASASPASTEEKSTSSEKSPKKEPAAKTSDIPAAALAILKKFPDYKELYIDTDGSMYTVKTAPAIRKGAVLYKNPYYES